MKLDQILKNFSNHKFSFISRKKFDWDGVFSICSTPVVYYSSNFIDFRMEYFVGNKIKCDDFSFGVQLNGEIICLLPLLYFENRDENGLSFLDRSIYPPIFSKSISKKIEKEISNLLFEKLKTLFNRLKLSSMEIFDHLYPSDNLSIWHKVVFKRASNCYVLRESFVKLSLDYSTIRSNYRKSYKSLISKGNELFEAIKLEKNHKCIWDEFKALHFKSAGRKTRSDKSWEILFNGLISKKYDFYFCADHDGVMKGGSLIMKSPFEAFYAIGAYDRDLFHLPIGHFLQDFIIKDLIKTDVRWYRLGRYFNNYDFDKPTEKEMQIGIFKSGFSTHLIPNYRFTKFK
tara:strand:- start:5057 stop:6088 length:1032 start_codon:yes stop_codon:yes gene_type:complete